MQCAGCLTINNDASEFCENCGQQLVFRSVCCSLCGFYNKSTAKFCNNCGKKLPSESGKETVLDERYRILGIIKSGAMGAVYQAEDMRLKILVAVKKLFNNAGNSVEAAKMEQMFKREAAMLASLSHPRLPKVFDYFCSVDENGRSSNFLVMSLIEGIDLERYLHTVRLPMQVNETVGLLLKIIDILHYLHTRTPPVIYRDIKPSNIVINSDKVFLVDFGIAKALESGKTGTMMGTAGYASPDQCRGRDSVSNDIYSLGALAHYLLTGRNPEDPARPLFTFEPVRRINPDVPIYLEKLISSMLEMRSADRPTSVDEVRSILKKGQKEASTKIKPEILAKFAKPGTTVLNLPCDHHAAKAAAQAQAPANKDMTPVFAQMVKTVAADIARDDFFDSVSFGDVIRLKAGISQGMDVNMSNSRGWTLLHDAVWNGQSEAVDILIKNGADINVRDSESRTPLHWAALYGRTAIIKYLIKNGAEVDAEDRHGWTALHYALEKNHTESSRFLEIYTSNIHLKNSSGQAPLEQKNRIISPPKSQPSLSPINPLGRQITPGEFFEAAAKGDIARLNAALLQGMDINIRNDQGKTALAIAEEKAFTLTADFLRNMGGR
ncbi:MAG: ankyrin repeat domain-containing protein [Firmicutes bacterium]|nr:ankyrin repeat domain-containing protein [Bacillota bacterium]